MGSPDDVTASGPLSQGWGLLVPTASGHAKLLPFPRLLLLKMVTVRKGMREDVFLESSLFVDAKFC